MSAGDLVSGEIEPKITHTPTPWVAYFDDCNPVGIQWCIRVPDSFHIADCMDNAALSGNVGRANAEFIVRACNAHDDLVKALEGVIRVADRATDEFDAARAALRKAGANN